MNPTLDGKTMHMTGKSPSLVIHPADAEGPVVPNRRNQNRVVGTARDSGFGFLFGGLEEQRFVDDLRARCERRCFPDHFLPVNPSALAAPLLSFLELVSTVNTQAPLISVKQRSPAIAAKSRNGLGSWSGSEAKCMSGQPVAKVLEDPVKPPPVKEPPPATDTHGVRYKVPPDQRPDQMKAAPPCAPVTVKAPPCAPATDEPRKPVQLSQTVPPAPPNPSALAAQAPQVPVKAPPKQGVQPPPQWRDASLMGSLRHAPHRAC